VSAQHNLDPRQREPYRRRPFNRRARQLGDVKRLIRHRYGLTLPNDDAARTDLFCLVYDLVKVAANPKQALSTWAEVSAPWAAAEDLVAWIARAERFVNWENRENGGIGWSDADIGIRLALTYDERSACAITTIAPCDLSEAEFLEKRRSNKRARSALWMEKQRRAAGVLCREDYLKTTLTAKAPWKDEGISRATWYRRQKAAARNVVRLDWARRASSTKSKVGTRHAPDRSGA
jgi:hypothetical protein